MCSNELDKKNVMKNHTLVETEMMQHRIQVPVQSHLMQRPVYELAEAVSKPALLISGHVAAGFAAHILARAPRTLQLSQEFVHVSTEYFLLSSSVVFK